MNERGIGSETEAKEERIAKKRETEHRGSLKRKPKMTSRRTR